MSSQFDLPVALYHQSITSWNRFCLNNGDTFFREYSYLKEMNSTSSNVNTHLQKQVVNISKTKPKEFTLKGVAYLPRVIIFCLARWTQVQTQELAMAYGGSRGQGREALLQALCSSHVQLGSASFSSSPSEITLQTWWWFFIDAFVCFLHIQNHIDKGF